MSLNLKKVYEAVGLGNFGSNSHPIHPATVHIPLAFLTVANILNLLYGMALFAPALFPFAADKENLGAITIMGYFLNMIGIFGSIPAIVTGFAELFAMISARGFYVDNKMPEKSLDPIVKTTLIHAGINDVAVLGAIYNWLLERGRPHEYYRPYPHQIILSGGTLVMSLYAAYLGGSLIYKHGVGVKRMGAGKEERKDEMKKAVDKTN